MQNPNHSHFVLNTATGRIVFSSDDLGLATQKAKEYHNNGGSRHLVLKAIGSTEETRTIDLVEIKDGDAALVQLSSRRM